MLLLSSADFFSKLTFSKNSFRNAIGSSNNLDPDQDRLSVGLDLGPNCSPRLYSSRQQKSPLARKELMQSNKHVHLEPSLTINVQFCY